MTDPKLWPKGVRVTVNGQPWNPAKSALFLLAFFGFCAAVVVWRQTLGRI